MLQPCSIQSPNSHVGKSCSLVGLRHKHSGSRQRAALPALAGYSLASGSKFFSLWICQRHPYSPNHRAFVHSLLHIHVASLHWALGGCLLHCGGPAVKPTGFGGEDRQTDWEWENSMKGAPMAGTQGKGVRNASRRKWPGKNFSNLGWVPLPYSSPHEQLAVHSADFPP